MRKKKIDVKIKENSSDRISERRNLRESTGISGGRRRRIRGRGRSHRRRDPAAGVSRHVDELLCFAALRFGDRSRRRRFDDCTKIEHEEIKGFFAAADSILGFGLICRLIWFEQFTVEMFYRTELL